MKKLEEKLGYSFGNPALLENALTHSSYANENRAKGRPATSVWSFWGTRCWAWWWPTTCSAAIRTCPRGS